MDFRQRKGRSEPHQGHVQTEDEAKAAWKRCWESADVPINWSPSSAFPFSKVQLPVAQHVAGHHDNRVFLTFSHGQIGQGRRCRYRRHLPALRQGRRKGIFHPMRGTYPLLHIAPAVRRSIPGTTGRRLGRPTIFQHRDHHARCRAGDRHSGRQVLFLEDQCGVIGCELLVPEGATPPLWFLGGTWQRCRSSHVRRSACRQSSN